MKWHHLEEWENRKNWNLSVYILREIQVHLQQVQTSLLMEHLPVSKQEKGEGQNERKRFNFKWKNSTWN